MDTYRSLETIQAVQYNGEPIQDVTCGGSPAEVQAHGCDSSRKGHTHVHTQAVGGMTVLKPGDWIFPVVAGPFGTAADSKFRSHWEVPDPKVGTSGPVLAGVTGAQEEPAALISLPWAEEESLVDILGE